MKSLRRLRELRDPEALRLLAWSFLTLLRVAFLLRTDRLPAIVRDVKRLRSHGSAGVASRCRDLDALDRVWRYSHAIITTLLRSRRPCLLRSLVAYRYGCKHGIPVSIHFGVKPGMKGLEGHSWITLQGRLLCESEDSVRSYTAVYSYPEASSEVVAKYVPATVGERARIII